MKLRQQTKISVATIVAMLILSSMALCYAVPQATADETATITINDGAQYTNSTTVELMLSATDAAQMRFSNDALPWTDWEPYVTQKTWELTDTDANKTVYVEFQDSQNQTIAAASAWIVVDRVTPIPYPIIYWASDDYRTVAFDGSLSQSVWGISSYQWDFGDGTQGEGVVTTHAYTEVGKHVATLTVIAPSGNSASQKFSVNIPDISDIAKNPTPTHQPTSTSTPHPTTQITPTPATAPVPTPAPVSFSGLVLVLVAAVVIVGVVCFVLVLVFWRKWKTPA